MKRLIVLIATVVLLSVVAVQTATSSEVAVVGHNQYPNDVNAVQNAVNKYDIVTLSGTFNFGQVVCHKACNPAGMVTITRPNVLLRADERAGATIVDGGAPSFTDWFWPVISISAPGVTVRGLTIVNNFDTGIFVSSAYSKLPTGNTITLENNDITAPWPALSLYRGGWPLMVRKNKLSGWAGFLDLWSVLTLDKNGELVQRTNRLDILNNDVTADGYDGISVWGWPVSRTPVVLGALPPWVPDTDGADWGDNAPVTITGNTVTMPGEWLDYVAISLGRSHAGLNHCVAANNTIRGKATWGIKKWPYGHDNSIVGNDLSGFIAGPGEDVPSGKVASTQIEVNARNTTVANNILGTVDGSYAFPMFIESVNYHPAPDELDTPMPLPVENCTIMENDYTHSNCPGWSQGLGCILVASEHDLRLNWGVGTEVRYNLIDETGKFPPGTGGPRNQIQVVPSPLVHDNNIVGLPAKD